MKPQTLTLYTLHSSKIELSVMALTSVMLSKIYWSQPQTEILLRACYPEILQLFKCPFRKVNAFYRRPPAWIRRTIFGLKNVSFQKQILNKYTAADLPRSFRLIFTYYSFSYCRSQNNRKAVKSVAYKPLFGTNK